MKSIPLDIYDDMPKGMKRYISNYGFHFTKKAYEYACTFMKKKDSSGRMTSVPPYSKEQVDNILRNHSIELENKDMYDYVYAAQMCKADFLGSSVPDEKHLAMYVKDTVDDADASSETTFRRWMATMIGNGKGIDWEEIV